MVRPLFFSKGFWASRSHCALFGAQALGFVDNASGNSLERLGVCARVVGAKQKLAAHLKFELHVSLRAAAIAAIVRGQSAFFKHRFHAPILALTRPRSEQ